jgi:uncharacterized protein YbjT (DUF2867 family)
VASISPAWARKSIRNSGVPFTIVRAAWFAQNFSEGYLRDPILGGVLPMPGGDIAEPIIDIDDIADVVVAALTEEGHLGERYEVTGPRLMTFAEMADVLSTTLGRPIQHIPIAFEDFHANVAASGGEFVADVFTQIARETLDGRNAYTCRRRRARPGAESRVTSRSSPRPRWKRAPGLRPPDPTQHAAGDAALLPHTLKLE